MRLKRSTTRIIEDKDFNKNMELIEDEIESLKQKINKLFKHLKVQA